MYCIVIVPLIFLQAESNKIVEKSFSKILLWKFFFCTKSLHICFLTLFLRKYQAALQDVFYKCSEKFCKIHKKTPVSKSLFDNVADSPGAFFIKVRSGSTRI